MSCFKKLTIEHNNKNTFLKSFILWKYIFKVRVLYVNQQDQKFAFVVYLINIFYSEINLNVFLLPVRNRS